MEYLPIIIWGVLAVTFGIVEAATAATVSIWFVVGCGAAFVAALLGGPFWLQFVLAVGVSGASFAGFRKMIAGKGGNARSLPSETISDGLAGKVGLVSEKIEAGMKGQVLVEGIQWTAVGMNEDEVFEEKSKVVVIRVDGTCCVVDKYEV